MRFLSFLLFVLSFSGFGCEATFAQALPSSAPASTSAASNLTWKAALMTGDDSIDAFDNARKTLKNEFVTMGVLPGNIKELSMNPREGRRGSLPSSPGNLARALQDLSIGDQDACLIHMTSHGSP